MTRTIVIAAAMILFVLGAADMASAQGPSPEANLAEMKKLDFLLGTWTGEAVYMMGPDKHVVQQKETIESKLGGLVIQIEGIGKVGDRLVHHAYAVIGYDGFKKQFTMRTFVKEGFTADPFITVGDKRVEWGLTTPYGKNRYTITLNERGEWIEIGERSTDGTTWVKFIEMTLKKQ